MLKIAFIKENVSRKVETQMQASHGVGVHNMQLSRWDEHIDEAVSSQGVSTGADSGV